MFYDMGSGSTTATIVTYQTVKSKETGTQPQLQIRGVGWVHWSLKRHVSKMLILCNGTEQDSQSQIYSHMNTLSTISNSANNQLNNLATFLKTQFSIMKYFIIHIFIMGGGVLFLLFIIDSLFQNSLFLSLLVGSTTSTKFASSC